MNQCEECIHNEVCRFYGLSDEIPCDFREVASDDVAPVRHGRWHDVYMSGPSSFTGTCSACGVSNDIPHPTNAHYCPNCGAKMDEEDNDD